MARRRKQNNAYEVSLSDGKTVMVYGSRYSDIQNGARAARAFGIDTIAVQRIFKDGKRGKRKGV